MDPAAEQPGDPGSSPGQALAERVARLEIEILGLKRILKKMKTDARNAVDCLIRDISPYGARLIFSDAVTTPDVLELYIPQKEQNGDC
jgi:hypothetical protein